MIRDRKLAAEVLKHLFGLSLGLEGSIATVLASCPDEEGEGTDGPSATSWWRSTGGY